MPRWSRARSARGQRDEHPACCRSRIATNTTSCWSRQRGAQIAALLGFDAQDQTRIATAVSEIARNAYEYAGGGRVEFHVDGERRARC